MNLLLLQGGGPTAVVNATLFAAIDEATRSGKFSSIFGARFGIEGLLRDDLIDLASLPQSRLEQLRTEPGASLGSTRMKPTPDQLQQIIEHLRRRSISHVLMIGGNGSLRGADALAQAAKDICVIGIPKTIDNDIVGTDRCPGFGSAARFVVQSVRELGLDVRTLPQPVSIFETMGRSVGWLAGASVLADFDGRHAPHLIYLPETPFDANRFIGDVDRIVSRNGWCVAVVPEGLRDARGEAVYQTTHATQADAMNRALPGGVAEHLAQFVTRELKIRCRSEKPGLLGRASIAHVSLQDRKDAELVGRSAVRAAIKNHGGVMVSLRPLGTSDDCDLIPLSTATGERAVPIEWINDSDNKVSQDFIAYVRRIVGDLPECLPPLAV